MDMMTLVTGAVAKAGVRIRSVHRASSSAMGDFLYGTLGLPPDWWVELPGPSGSTVYALRAEAREALMPGYATAALGRALHPQAPGDCADRALEREIAVALLGGPVPFRFESVAAFASHVRVQRRVAQAAARTAVAFKTLAAERPAQYWHYDEEAGFVLNEDAPLVEALRAATQPEVTGQRYDFSCYRASEYVILLGLAEELRAHHAGLLARLEARCRRRAIRSREFHEVFLDEFGSLDQPLPARYFVPGDRLWFRNPDARSSDALGYEGSWVVYLGSGLFSNFWKPGQAYTLEDKCIEIFHWRDGAYRDDDGQWLMDEDRVDACVARTQAEPARRQEVLQRMLRLRDAQGVYALGGCLDASREQARGAWPGACRVAFQAA